MRMSGPEKNEAVPAEPAVIMPKKRRWPWLVLVFLLAAAGVIWHFRLYEPYLPEPAEETAEPVPETILFEAYPTPVQEYGTAFRPVQVVRAHDGELSVQKEPDMTRIGEQTAEFLVRKKRDDGSVIEQVFLVTVTIRDTRKPVIELKEEDIVLDTGEAFDITAAVERVYDRVDGDLAYAEEEQADSWTFTSEPDPDVPGVYEVTIIATDRNGLTARAVCRVTVTGPDVPEKTAEPKETEEPAEDLDTTPPVIRLKFLQVEIRQNEAYGIDDNIISITDETDGALPYSDTLVPGSYSVRGGIDVRRSGVYSVTLTAMDKAGNQSSAVFTVTVKEAEQTPEPETPEPVSAVNLSGGTAQEQIMNYITGTMGLNRAAACGIVAHMRHESSLNPQAYNPSGYYGLCQWGGGRYENLMNWCGANGLDYTTIGGQLQFMNMELSGAYAGVLSQLQSVEDSADGAYDAAWAFGMSYEVSGEYLADLAGQTARSLYGE